MRVKELYIILGVFVGLIGLILLLLFEFRQESTLDWRKNYSPQSQEAYGTWIFKNLTEKRFGSDNFILMDDTFDLNESDQNSLYVFVGNMDNYDTIRFDKLLNFHNQGNEVLIISDDFYVFHDSIDLEPLDHLHYVFGDEVSLYNCKESVDTLRFKNYWKDFESGKYENLRYFNSNMIFDDLRYEPLLCSNDSMIVFLKDMTEGQSFYYHFQPRQFSNLASADSDFLPHLNYVFDQIEAESVYFDSARNHFDDNELYNESPLKYVLSNESLSWAYYLIIFFTLIYVIVGSRRKVKPIPIMPKNKNSSLEYVRVLSELFQAQDQNNKLVIHISDNFEHEIKRRYYLDPKDAEYLNRLSKKSKVKEEAIKKIFYFFKKAKDKQSISDEELNTLYNHIEYFKQNAI